MTSRLTPGARQAQNMTIEPVNSASMQDLKNKSFFKS
nr:MAG TPA: hypothetical protein [Caudoviricetes sp.]